MKVRQSKFWKRIAEYPTQGQRNIALLQHFVSYTTTEQLLEMPDTQLGWLFDLLLVKPAQLSKLFTDGDLAAYRGRNGQPLLYRYRSNQYQATRGLRRTEKPKLADQRDYVYNELWPNARAKARSILCGQRRHLLEATMQVPDERIAWLNSIGAALNYD